MGEQPDGRRQNLRALVFVAVAALFYLGVRVALSQDASCAGSTEDRPSGAASGSPEAVGQPPPSVASAPGPADLPQPADPILYADVERKSETAPARFAAALPERVEDFQPFLEGDAKYPPASHVEDRICLGDEDMQGRLVTALAAAAQAGATPADLVGSYGHLVEWCRTDGVCGWAEGLVKGQAKAAVRAVAWHALARCTGQQYAELFERRGVPAASLIEFLSRAGGPAPYSKRVERAALEVIGSGSTADVRRAAFVLGDSDHARAAAALLDLYGETSDAERKAEIALAMRRQSDPRAQAAFNQACRARPADPACRDRDAGKAPDPGAGEAGAAPGGDPVALRSCVETDESPAEQYACLAQLVAADRRLATETVKGSGGQALLKSRNPDLAELAAAVQRYPSTESLRAALRKLGLVPEEVSLRPADLAARELMRAARRVHEFDAETGEYPNHHDSLLRTLAAMGGGPLAHVLFAEQAPPLDQPGTPYRLTAYVRGEAVSAKARNLGDWYDVRAVVGLLNVLARDLGLDTRFVVLGATDQTAAVAVGPEAGLRSAIADGLLSVAAADQAMLHGRMIERQLAGEAE